MNLSWYLKSQRSLGLIWYWQMEPVRGVEPLTCGLRNRCSTTELHRLRGSMVAIFQLPEGLERNFASTCG